MIGQVVVGCNGEARWATNAPVTVPSGATASFQAVWIEAASGRGDSSNVLRRTSP